MRLFPLPSALLCVLLAACGGAPDRPRNVILISLDTLRPDHLGCYGHARDTSPAIDALAARGVRFADASSAAPWTLPSHATMFTGLYPSHHGVKDYSHRLPQESVTLAEALREHGFQTCAVVNTWNIADPRFDVFQGFDPADVHYVKETRAGAGGAEVVLNTGPEVVATAREWLAGRDRSRPFFLLAHFYDAHTDFTPDAPYRERFVAPYAGPLDGTTGQLLQIRARGSALGQADLAFLREMYDAEIRQLDDLLGGFVEWLADEDLARDTLIVLTSDHGEEFQEHGGLLHGRTQFQELLAVPLILAGPGVPRGRVVEEPVSLVDLLPTILARLGIPLPGPVDGIDLAPSWSGGALPARALFGEADHNNVVDGRHVIDIKRMARLADEKLHQDRHTKGVQLFDLAADPTERNDLAAAAPERVRLLEAALARFLDGAVAGQEHGQALTEENQGLLRQLGYGGDDGRK